MSDTGEKIRFVRESKDLSQEQFAEVLGVSRQTVSKWETGAAVPDGEKIAVLCERLGVRRQFFGEGEANGVPSASSARIAPEVEAAVRAAPKTLRFRFAAAKFFKIYCMAAAALIAAACLAVLVAGIADPHAVAEFFARGAVQSACLQFALLLISLAAMSACVIAAVCKIARYKREKGETK